MMASIPGRGGRLAATMEARPAGCPTHVADPLWKATPSASVPRAMPSGNFPLGVSFRLPTPERVGIGVRINEFKPPEKESYHVAAERNGTNFSRGHRFFDHYSNMQQRANLLVPTLPRHSRVDELSRVWNEKLHHEAHRDATLALLDYNERRRLDRLRSTKGLLQQSASAHAIGRELQRSCSSTELVGAAPFGSRTSALELLNRRVDVNRIRKAEKSRGSSLARRQRHVEEDKEVRLEEVVDSISDFEAAHLPQQAEAMRTTSEWSSFRRPGAPPSPVAEEVSDEELRATLTLSSSSAFRKSWSWQERRHHTVHFEV